MELARVDSSSRVIMTNPMKACGCGRAVSLAATPWSCRLVSVVDCASCPRLAMVSKEQCCSCRRCRTGCSECALSGLRRPAASRCTVPARLLWEHCGGCCCAVLAAASGEREMSRHSRLSSCSDGSWEAGSCRAPIESSLRKSMPATLSGLGPM